MDSALAFISGERARLGALQSRFETSIANLQVTAENLSARARASWMPTSPRRTANLSRAQILQQAGTAMVAQANQLPPGRAGPAAPGLRPFASANRRQIHRTATGWAAVVGGPARAVAQATRCNRRPGQWVMLAPSLLSLNGGVLHEAEVR